MANFIFYDLAFLVLFGIFAILFFYRNKQNLKRQGWIFLYHTKLGIKFINWTARKFERVLKPLSYVVIASGYVLMTSILWLIVKTVWIYISTPIPEQLQNLPPIAPLIPYFPKIFNLESLFPPLYFTYFLIALAIVAVSHEFAHGIYARLWKIKVKTTGLAFFGPFFGAFVEPDEKKMAKAPKKHQLSILAAGTFANVIMFVLFLGAMWLFFTMSFVPSGVIFNTYAQRPIYVNDISAINNITINNLEDIYQHAQEGLNRVRAGEKDYLAPQTLLTQEIISNNEQIIVFEDSPAINAKIEGAITFIDGKETKSYAALSNALNSKLPGETTKITTKKSTGEVNVYEVKLAEREGKAFLGVGFYPNNREGFSGKVYGLLVKVKDPQIFYEPSWDGDFVQFIYDLLWWIVIINVLVALMNMLPVAILDGGRFFYLTMLAITGSEKWSKKVYSWITWFILFLIFMMMAKWFLGLF